MEILLANPRGFCAGVDRAIEIVQRALDLFGAPIYVRHEVVHNRYVVDSLTKAGAIFVDELDQVPDNATVIFSAHGVSKSVRRAGGARGLQVFDATCPLVTKVHMEVARHCRAGRDVVLIGHAGHPEVEGTLGQWINHAPRGNNIYLVENPADVESLQVTYPEDIAFVTQTTLSVDDTQASSTPCAKSFRRSAGRSTTISVTQPKTGRMRSRSWPGAWNWCWWWDQ